MIKSTSSTKHCQQCDKLFFKKYSESYRYWKTKKYCSPECRVKSTLGTEPWNKGIVVDRNKYPKMGRFGKQKLETLLVMKKALDKWRSTASLEEQKIARTKGHQKAVETGMCRGSFKGHKINIKDSNGNWLGDDATYNSKHRWIQKNWTKTGICQRCAKTTHPFGKRRFGTEWHNLDNAYNRDKPETWLEVCSSCHKLLNKYKNGQNQTG